MNWRPKGWKILKQYIGLIDDLQQVAYEAGADDMLNSLKKEGFHTENLDKKWRTKVFGNKSGWIIFIPEEEI